jgi:hypothetical protein
VDEQEDRHPTEITGHEAWLHFRLKLNFLDAEQFPACLKKQPILINTRKGLATPRDKGK